MSSNIDVNVKVVRSGRLANFQLNPDLKIQDVCEQIAQEEKVSTKQIIIKYTGKILSRLHTLSYLGVRPETVLKAEVVEIQKYNIYVQKEDEVGTIPLCIENITTVQDVRSMISERLEVDPSKDVILELNGKKIIGKHTEMASKVGLIEECMLKVKLVESAAAAASRRDEHDNEVQQELDEAALQELLSSFAVEAGNNVEVVFSFDTTGSMSACLAQVRSKVEETTKRLLRDIPNIRIGIIAHGDYCDQSNYVLRVCDLTDNRKDLIQFIKDVPSTGGGDSPECYEWVLKKAQDLDWTEGSARALVMIGDDLPHPPSYTDQCINWHTELDRLRDINVKVYGVQALNSSQSTLFYEELAHRTAGIYLKFTQFNYITDMFLAVCYRESSDEQLQAYCEEVKNDGRMTEELTSMFVKLEEKPTAPSPKSNSDKYVALPWWDPSLDKIPTPQYSYNAKTDKWSTYDEKKKTRSARPVSTHETTSSSTEGSVEPRRRFLSFLRRKRNKTTSKSKSTKSKE